MKNLTPSQKKQKLATLIELMVSCGYSINDFMGKPLSHYNFEKIDQGIEKLKLDYFESNGCEFYDLD